MKNESKSRQDIQDSLDHAYPDHILDLERWVSNLKRTPIPLWRLISEEIPKVENLLYRLKKLPRVVRAGTDRDDKLLARSGPFLPYKNGPTTSAGPASTRRVLTPHPVPPSLKEAELEEYIPREGSLRARVLEALKGAREGKTIVELRKELTDVSSDLIHSTLHQLVVHKGAVRIEIPQEDRVKNGPRTRYKVAS